MTSADWLSLVALSAWLIFALAAYRSRRLSASTTAKHVIAWVTAFVFLAVLFTVIAG